MQLAYLTERTLLSPCSQVHLVILENLVWKVLLALAAPLAGRETADRPVSLVSETRLEQTIHHISQRAKN